MRLLFEGNYYYVWLVLTVASIWGRLLFDVRLYLKKYGTHCMKGGRAWAEVSIHYYWRITIFASHDLQQLYIYYTNHTRRERNCSEMTKVCITSEHQLYPIMKQSSVYLDSGVDLPHKQTSSNVPHCPCNHIRTIRYIHVHTA